MEQIRSLKRHLLISGVSALWKCRGSHDHTGVRWLQGVINEREIFLVVLWNCKHLNMACIKYYRDTYPSANVLDHFNADKCIECMLKMRWDITIVQKVNTNFVLEAGRFNSFFSQFLLFLWQCKAIHLTPKSTSSLASGWQSTHQSHQEILFWPYLDGKSTPTGAKLQNSVSGLHACPF